MMDDKQNKVFVLLPDGVGLRNFAYTNFYKVGKELGNEVVFWNNTPFELKDLGFDSAPVKSARSHPFTEVLKNARKQIELDLYTKKDKDQVYQTYKFPFSFRNTKVALKSIATIFYSKWYGSNNGLIKIRSKIKKYERKSPSYLEAVKTLKEHRPDIVFCTNQRPMSAIGPILAAQDLGIPTATFIFSWDNLPKATMVVETDYYMVWGEHMKKELLHYYPYINEEQVFVTGTPQFEMHFNPEFEVSKEEFYREHNLDLATEYICFSGDDVTTSPHDPEYLENTAKAIRSLNDKGFELGIIFRRCPVDFSGRYDHVLKAYEKEIVSIAPKWDKIGGAWNSILPTKEDQTLLANTARHTIAVVNLGSSMVFDYICHDKPCAFINFKVEAEAGQRWQLEKIYKYVHFRSMPSRNAVYWIEETKYLESILRKAVETNNEEVLESARQWFEVITAQPPQKASNRIWKAIETIISYT